MLMGSLWVDLTDASSIEAQVLPELFFTKHAESTKIEHVGTVE